MIFAFTPFTLCQERAELVGPEGVIAVEPKAFAVLRLLVENHERMVSRGEMIEVVWGGRFISDAAVSTALKMARRAVGDDGVRQAFIRTLHGVGHRFVAPVQRRLDASVAAPQAPEPADQGGQRPTIVVLPFRQNAGDTMQIGDGLADEIISSLSRLRWLRVIARETTFRFRGDAVDLASLRGILGAGYALTGRVELVQSRLHVLVTLVDTKTGSVIWADQFSRGLDDIHSARQEIVTAVIGALDLQISQAEAASARTKPSEMLDAWGAFHLGMSHLHRFNAHDNAIASRLLERATELDPGFAVAFAARSFARFQDALQWFRSDRGVIAVDVRRLAERAVELDPFDPFANMSMGRWHWLAGSPDDGLEWYERSIHLSPSSSKGHYTRAMVDAFAGRAEQARAGANVAQRLSPLDPMMGPMLAVKAFSYLVEGDYAAAREWGQHAVRSSPTHSNILALAIATSQMAGDHAQAVHWAAILRGIMPNVAITMYLQSVPFANPDLLAKIREALHAIGMPD